MGIAFTAAADKISIVRSSSDTLRLSSRISFAASGTHTHWSSRADDPQLHDHVMVWNRARSVSDGRWRTIDSRALFKAVTTLSELYQGVLSDLLTDALGVGWEARPRRHSDPPRFELAGVEAG